MTSTVRHPDGTWDSDDPDLFPDARLQIGPALEELYGRRDDALRALLSRWVSGLEPQQILLRDSHARLGTRLAGIGYADQIVIPAPEGTP